MGIYTIVANQKSSQGQGIVVAERGAPPVEDEPHPRPARRRLRTLRGRHLSTESGAESLSVTQTTALWWPV